MTTVAPTLDLERQGRAREYARIRRRLMALQLILGGTYAILWLAAGWHIRLREAIGTALAPILGGSTPWWVELLLVALGLGLPWFVLTLPLSFYSGFTLPHRYELSTQTVYEWIKDLVKGLLVSAVLGPPLLVATYFILRQWPDTWWIWAALLYTAFSAGLTAIAPVVLVPLFFKFEPLGEEHADLKRRLVELADAAGTHVRGVYRIDLSRRTKAANAALVGLGRTRRIVLGDTLLSNFEPIEIETVMAHELAHHVHRDIPLLLLAQSASTFATFFLIFHALRTLAAPLGLQGIADPAGLPALGLLSGAIGLIIMPLANGFSRWRERMADDYAIHATKAPAAFARALTRLANQNLADFDPEPWVVYLLHDHPPLRARVEAAKRHAADVPEPAVS